MNRRGQLEVGMVIMIAIVAIVGAILLVASARNVGETKDIATIANETITMGANGTAVAMPGSGISGSAPVAYVNSTVLVGAGNFTYASRQVLNGVWTATVTVLNSNLSTTDVNISYLAEPDGFITSAGGRNVAGLIIIFFAIAIAVVMLVPTLRSKILDGIGK